MKEQSSIAELKKRFPYIWAYEKMKKSPQYNVDLMLRSAEAEDCDSDVVYNTGVRWKTIHQFSEEKQEEIKKYLDKK